MEAKKSGKIRKLTKDKQKLRNIVAGALALIILLDVLGFIGVLLFNINL